MSYQALYRTWRPQSFSSLIGQPHVRQTLMNALKSGQIAHAYLFSGPRGTGKTSAAKLFAKAVNCLQPDGAEPCNQCDSCVSITMGNNVDVEEIDAASNRGVDEIRELRDKVHYAPTSVKKKVYIVDEVHMLTTEAFNALLKTLEEPPSHVMFMLATTEPHKIPNTIISRCQRFDFHRISTETIVARLLEVAQKQEWTFEESALWKLAEAADGGLRDALGLLEQASAFGHGTVDEQVVANVIGGVNTDALLQLVESLLNHAYLAVVEQLGKWYAGGKDANRITFDLLQVLRDLFIVALSKDDQALGGKPVDKYKVLAQNENCQTEWLLGGIRQLGELYTQLRYIEQPRLALEASLLSIATQEQTRPTVAPAPSQPVATAPPVSAPIQAPSPSPVTSVPQPAQGQAAVPAAAESVAVSATGHAGVAGADAPSPAQAAQAKPTTQSTARAARATSKNATNQRKQEALERLYADRDVPLEETLKERWGDILHKVKADRIQTHAWLMNGEVVMSTGVAVVLSFASRIHREAVMKPVDRQVIEAAISTMMERDMQIFALLKADWDAFVATVDKTDAPEEPAEPSTDIVAVAKSVFGEEKVVIEDEE